MKKGIIFSSCGFNLRENDNVVLLPKPFLADGSQAVAASEK